MELTIAFLEKLWGHYFKLYNDSFHIIILYFALPFFVLVLELLVLGWDHCSLKKITRPDKSAQNDIVSFIFFNSKLHEVFGYSMFLGLAIFIPKHFRELFGFNLIQTVPNIYIQVLIFFIFSDFIDYWIHRLEHQSKTFWQLHKYHHSCTEFTVLTAHRSHPLSEVSIKKVLKIIPLAIIGMPLETFLLMVIITRVLSFLQHSQLHWTFGWIGKYVLISPAAHRIHHNIDEQHHNKNFGGFLVWWDRLFSTWQNVTYDHKGQVGVVDNKHSQHNYFMNIMMSYFDFLKFLTARLSLFFHFLIGMFNHSQKLPNH